MPASEVVDPSTVPATPHGDTVAAALETSRTAPAAPLTGFDFHLFADDALRLGLAVCLGALIGSERQLAGQSAGLRTHVLVALGAAVFVLSGITGARDPNLTRVVQGVAAGVGFIGAGAIVRSRSEDRVRGLTTAGTIWVAAAMGVAAGLGEYALAAASGLITLFVLLALRPLSRWLSKFAREPEQGS